MKELRVGVIGVGSFGELHVAAFQAVPQVEVTLICDTREERLREVQSKYGVSETCSDYRELCDRQDIDAVSVVTPESEHLEPVMAAAAAGKPIFLEKPIATSLEDGEKILQAARNARVILMVGHILRFENQYATVKHLIDKGELGEVVSIHARRNRPKSLYQIYGNRVHPFVVNSVHDIDLCLWYTGRNVHRVHGFSRNVQAGKNPDVNWGFIEFEGGAVACVETHWLVPDEAGVGTDDAIQVIGSKGLANVDLVAAGLKLWLTTGTQIVNLSYDAWFHGQIRGPLKEEASYFVECVRSNRSPQVIRPEEALEALRVALSLEQSAREQRPVELNMH